jgi:hypothetical protein
MKSSKIIILSMCLFSLSSCLKDLRPSRDACISVDKTTAKISELITISNCGSDLPLEYVSPTIDWGDGNESTGQVGTHNYSTAGTYVIKLKLNGSFASDVLEDVEESKVTQTVIIQ